jgi:hypothetical protein
MSWCREDVKHIARYTRAKRAVGYGYHMPLYRAWEHTARRTKKETKKTHLARVNGELASRRREPLCSDGAQNR